MITRQLGQILGSPAAIKKSAEDAAADTAVVITITGVAGYVHMLHGVQWSYDDDPVGGSLLIQSGATTIFEVDITASGPGGFIICLPAEDGEDLVITLAAAGGTTVGKLNCQYVTQPA